MTYTKSISFVALIVLSVCSFSLTLKQKQKPKFHRFDIRLQMTLFNVTIFYFHVPWKYTAQSTWCSPKVIINKLKDIVYWFFSFTLSIKSNKIVILKYEACCFEQWKFRNEHFFHGAKCTLCIHVRIYKLDILKKKIKHLEWFKPLAHFTLTVIFLSQEQRFCKQ